MELTGRLLRILPADFCFSIDSADIPVPLRAKSPEILSTGIPLSLGRCQNQVTKKSPIADWKYPMALATVSSFASTSTMMPPSLRESQLLQESATSTHAWDFWPREIRFELLSGPTVAIRLTISDRTDLDNFFASEGNGGGIVLDATDLLETQTDMAAAHCFILIPSELCCARTGDTIRKS